VSERLTEEYLVLKAQAGNEKAFAILYRSYHAALVRFSYRMCSNEQAAHDAVQEAWVTIARTITKLHDPKGFRPRVFKAVRWRTLDYLRQQKVKMVSLEEMSDNNVEPDIEAASDVSGWATKSQIAALVAQLPECEQQAIHLFYLEDMKLSEIAAILDIPTGTLKSRLNRARGRLHRLVSEECDVTGE